MLASGCSGKKEKPAGDTEPVTPITTTYASQPSSGCSVHQVRSAFAKRGIELLVAIPETSLESPLLGVLKPSVEGNTRSALEVTILRTPEEADRLLRAKAKPPPKQRGFAVTHAVNIIAVYPRNAPVRLREAVRAVVARLGCRDRPPS
jgi:hypothetical protein